MELADRGVVVLMLGVHLDFNLLFLVFLLLFGFTLFVELFFRLFFLFGPDDISL